MSKIVLQATNDLKTAIQRAIEKAQADGSLPETEIPQFTIEVPADRTHGDWATNAAMVSAKAFRLAPRKIAQVITDNIALEGTFFDRFEIAGPGFINFFLSQNFYTQVLKDITVSGSNYGRSDYGKKEKIMVEFVSANPTGPMHMGNARGGALGDCLASVLDAAGYDVWREFYVNDAGNQIEKFGSSLSARYLQIFKGENAVEFPEDGYQGDDIKERASEFAEIYGDKYVNAEQKEREKALVEFALPKNIKKMESDLKKYGIEYDEWFLESRLHNDGELTETIQILKDKGLTYEKDGAIWYKATEFGAEKDEVLVRQNGNPTYFAADIAYHRNKFQKRGFNRCIDVWGADHHGHVARMKGAMDAIGLDGSKLDIVLIQLVRLVKSGEVVRMSKRTGKAIQLADLLDEVPVDAARFYFNMREATSQMDFDLDLAVQQDSQNPVYYVQYAHARICSIFKTLAAEGIHLRDCTDEELALLTAPEEIELIRHLSAFTSEIIAAAQDYDPARITRYVITLATLFHKFYNACRVKGENESLTAARLYLCNAVAIVIRNVLSMFKISAPESM
ncbi:arginine--tRNA ligase [Caproiciproducens galactitolivorans]|uniref:Arginine--tRNA ligase n=1 Tax=Caproiciproducens galactitolivorans TaxID=642589 RepID=A0A4Z0YFY2_9FIRM|nr:arginine--tRNA ligase [Caproiciproducens galactitolivorans]QEY34677.1 arginine--tRNA ligase [Caproiciproducens galactitolivorans]TGJ75852.1 arginine--tRNA ligase [Caproiciproducens galactitolivorans]